MNEGSLRLINFFTRIGYNPREIELSDKNTGNVIYDGKKDYERAIKQSKDIQAALLLRERNPAPTNS